jgi:hypothetical protein
MTKNDAITDALSNEVLSSTSAIVQRAEDALAVMDMAAGWAVSVSEITAATQEVADFYKTGSLTLNGIKSLSDNAVVIVREIEHLNFGAGLGSRLLPSVNQEYDRRLVKNNERDIREFELVPPLALRSPSDVYKSEFESTPPLVLRPR